MSINALMMRHAGLEELGIEDYDTGLGGEQIEQLVAEKEAAEDSAKVEELSSEVAELTEAVESAQETIEELEETVEGIESLLSGNWNSKAAEISYKRLVRLSSKAGGDIRTDVMGSESFSDSSTAEMFMRQGVESAMDTIKKWGTSAIEFIKKIYNSVVTFIVGLFNKAKGMRRQIAAYKEAMKHADFQIKKDIKLGGWNRYTDIGKTTSNIEIHAKVVDNITAAIGDIVGNIKKLSTSPEDYKTEYTKVVGYLNAICPVKGKKKAGVVTTAIGMIAGIRAVWSWSDPEDIKKSPNIGSSARNLKLTFSNDPDTKIKLDGDYKTKLGIPELNAVLSEVVATCVMLEQEKSSKALNSATRDMMVSEINSMDSENTPESKTAVGNITALYASSMKISANVSKYMGDVGGAKLSMVGAHMGKIKPTK